MQKIRYLIAAVAAWMILISIPLAAIAGQMQIVDKNNWQAVKGLVPDPVLGWLKKGDWMMRVGKLKFDPAKTQPSWVIESHKTNAGRYTLNNKFVIVDAKTGKEPKFIKGIPFPKIDPKDPMAAAKIMYNGSLVRQNVGPMRNSFRLTFMNGNSGKLERYIKVNWWSWAFEGWPPAADMANPDHLEFYTQNLITEPYDMAGTALMTWRYMDDKEDMLFGYVPAIRRVRRLTPAGRSDALFGSDFARDDGSYSAYDGRIGDMKWKILGEGVILGGFNSAVPQKIKINDAGEWVIQGMQDRRKYAAFGYEDYAKDYYKGKVAPWCQTNTVWVKRPVWIVEGLPQNPYYNYGREIHWIDKETFVDYWKQIYDRSDEYWKMLWMTWGVAVTDDGKEGISILSSMVLDERLNHCSAIDEYGKDCYYTTNAKTIDLSQFSLPGFTKLSK